MAWKKFIEVNDEMNHIINKLKDENISLIFDTTVFEGLINQVLELQIKIEKVFIDKSPEELGTEKKPEGKEEGQNKYVLSPAQLDRQKLVQHCNKLDLRNQGMKMCVAVIALQVLIGGMIEGGSNVN